MADWYYFICFKIRYVARVLHKALWRRANDPKVLQGDGGSEDMQPVMTINACNYQSQGRSSAKNVNKINWWQAFMCCNKCMK